MGLLDKFTKDSKSESDPTAAPRPEKKSLYKRFHDSKRGEINDEDLKKYTGMSKAQVSNWSQDKEVGGNQLAGKTALGDANFSGWAGWGWSANARPKHLPTKASPDGALEGKALGSEESLAKVEKK